MSNAAKLQSFVDGHLAIAAKKSPADAHSHLMGWANWVNEQIALLDRPGALPAHLVGVSAFDLANARDTLASAAPAEAA